MEIKNLYDTVEEIGRNLQKILWENVDNNEQMDKLQSQLNENPKCLLVGEDKCFYNTSELKKVEKNVVERTKSSVLAEFVVKTDAIDIDNTDIIKTAVKGR